MPPTACRSPAHPSACRREEDKEKKRKVECIGAKGRRMVREEREPGSIKGLIGLLTNTRRVTILATQNLGKKTYQHFSRITTGFGHQTKW